MSKELRGSLILLLASFIWGSAFVSQSVGMDYMGPITFLFARSFLTVVFLLVLVLVVEIYKKKNGTYKKQTASETKVLIKGGMICGVCLVMASVTQQIGIQFTTVGKSGFLTATYMLFVPLLGIFIGKKTNLKIWISLLVAGIGLYFLSAAENLRLNFGDLMCLLCGFLFAFQILAIDKYSPICDGIKLSLIQFTTCMVISFFLMMIFEKPVVSNILAGWITVAYAGIMSGGIAYTFQIVGQRDTHPAIASLCMSFESFFAAVSGAVILKQIPHGKELLGLILMFIAIIYSQLPTNFEKKK